MLLRALCLSGCLYILSGCASSSDDTNIAPSVTVTSELSVAGGESVTLTVVASDSDGTIESYLWEQVSGDDVELEGETTDTLEFDAPAGLSGYELEFRITVTDNEGGSSSVTVTVTVAEGIESPDNFLVRSPVDSAGVVFGWDAISLSDDADGEISYSLYYAQETFQNLSDLDDYDELDGTGVETDITDTSYQMDLSNGEQYYFLLTASYVSDTLAVESQPTAEVARVIGKDFSATDELNDTSVTECVDTEGEWASCPVDDRPGQDAEYGRTAEEEAGSLTKTGTGLGGFDWTLLDEDGSELSPGSELAECIRDNVTGMTIELKSSTTNLRDPVHQFSWYQDDDTLNGGYAGLEDGPECVSGVCNTSAYAAALNLQTLCGASDWRLPVVAELRSVADIAGACLDDGGGCKLALDYYYWTATTRADSPDQAWMVNLYGKADTSYDKQASARVIMVSDGTSDE
ncbi:MULTISPECIES: DUF1566 domain-containing protein [unclassified Oceanobacter]|uniref:Lcl C-terminal domain-containing protein n=1 Tax=unclassified Oceanobacter TaxID=2620260 RepID=UPI00273298F7|nr:MULTISPECIES: DUF1566 domain-containing protein [unclassified Oceanobacter]MDP2610315.1 DUF1566 domain-containing protein [Oceanobacter sp. 1_MG-2023]MDP2613547.1 DUF1566 domain-containing protein [Oceanobacter sp. 2_MG-2023]